MRLDRFLFLLVGIALLLAVSAWMAYAQAFGTAPVVINEVMWMGSDLSTADEWVELLGLGSESSDTTPIGGWTLTGRASNGSEVPLITFPPDAAIGLGELLLISRFSATGSRLAAEPAFRSSALSLLNSKLLLRLRDDQGNLVDQADDGVGSPLAGLNASGTGWKASMERIAPLLAGDRPDAWSTARTFLGFDDGAPLYGTPGFSSTIGPSEDLFPPEEPQDVTLDVLVDGTGSLLTFAWIPGHSLDLAAYQLDFDPPLLSGFGSVLLPSTATGTVIAASSDAAYFIRLFVTDTSGNQSEGLDIELDAFQDDAASASASSSSESASSIGSEIESESSSSTEFSFPSSNPSFSSIESSTSSETSTSSASSDSFQFSQSSISLQSSSASVSSSSSFSSSTSFSTSSSSISSSLASSASFASSSQSSSKASLSSVASSSSQSSASFRSSFSSSSASSTCLPWDAIINLQSGTTRGEGKVTLNPEIVVTQGTKTGLRCLVEFGDGSISDSCNPPSHAYSQVGSYTLRATIVNYCNTTMVRTLDIFVEELPKEDEEDDSTPSSGSAEDDDEDIQLSESHSSANFIIHAALPNPTGTDGDAEWIEVKNASSFEGNLTGWILRDQTSGARFKFASAVVRAGQVKRVLADELTLSLRNTDATVQLVSPEGVVTSVIGWSIADVDHVYVQGDTVENTKKETESDNNANITNNNSYSSFNKNSSKSFSALNENKNKEQNFSSLKGMIRLSEIYATPDTSGESFEMHEEEEWIELYNASGEFVSLENWLLDDQENGGSRPWKFPQGYGLHSNSYSYVLRHTTRLALNNGGDSVILLAPDGTVMDTVSFPKLRTGQSYARVQEDKPQLSTRWCVTDDPTPEARNRCLQAETGTAKATVTKATASKSSKASSKKSVAPKVTVKKAAAKSSKAKSSSAKSALTTDLKDALSASLRGDQMFTSQNSIPWVDIIALFLGLTGVGFLVFRSVYRKTAKR